MIIDFNNNNKTKIIYEIYPVLGPIMYILQKI